MRDNLFFGFALGTIFPVLAFLLVQYTALGSSFMPEKPISLYAIAAVINLIATRFIYRAGKEDTAKGIVLATFMAMIIMIFVLRIKI